MNPDYRKSLFRVGVADDELPSTFAVVTVCNPDGVKLPAAENAARSEAFRMQLVECGLHHFPVTGYDPDGPHQEAGFGVECDRGTAMAFGRQWEQEAIFWIERGKLILVSCKDDEEFELGTWTARVDP
jgi:Protein of unknown function (DUF3293)